MSGPRFRDQVKAGIATLLVVFLAAGAAIAVAPPLWRALRLFLLGD